MVVIVVMVRMIVVMVPGHGDEDRA
jgi:hypothetical protein